MNNDTNEQITIITIESSNEYSNIILLHMINGGSISLYRTDSDTKISDVTIRYKIKRKFLSDGFYIKLIIKYNVAYNSYNSYEKIRKVININRDIPINDKKETAIAGSKVCRAISKAILNPK